MTTELAAQFVNRCFGGTHDAAMQLQTGPVEGRIRQCLGHMPHCRFPGTTDHETSQTTKWRIGEFAAVLHLGFRKGDVVVTCGGHDGRVFRIKRLHHDTTATRSATGSSGDLRNQVKGPFTGAKIKQVQRRIGIDHADQSDVGEIQALGNHLCAQQNSPLARAKQIQCRFMAAGPLHRIGIHANA